jgi:hypothetical protein
MANTSPLREDRGGSSRQGRSVPSGEIVATTGGGGAEDATAGARDGTLGTLANGRARTTWEASDAGIASSCQVAKDALGSRSGSSAASAGSNASIGRGAGA